MDKKGPWIKLYFCEKCENQLSFNTVMGSHGCCPFCGGQSGGTVVRTKSKSIRKISPWWRFWNKKYELSEGWTNG